MHRRADRLRWAFVCTALVVSLFAFPQDLLGAPYLHVRPQGVVFRTVVGQTAPVQSITIRNGGDAVMPWTSTPSVGWLVASPASGSLNPGESQVIQVAATPPAPAAGQAQAMLTIDAPASIWWPQETVEAFVVVLDNTCRGQFFALDVVGADDCFQTTLAVSPTNPEANFFRAFSRILRVCEEQVDGPDPFTFTDSCKEMLDQFGYPSVGRSLFDWTAGSPDPFPTDSPRGGEVQEFWRDVLLAEMLAALSDNLAQVPQSYTTFIDAEETASLSGEPSAEVVDLDFGDVKALEAMLNFVVGTMAMSLISQDLDFDIDAASLVDVAIQAALNADPTLLALAPGGATVLSQARESFQDGIEAYYAASAFVRFLDDPLQSDDLLVIDDLAEDLAVRTDMGEVYCSMDGVPLTGITQTAVQCGTGGTPRIGGDVVDLSQFFGNPTDLRDLLPAFQFDASCGKNWVDDSSVTPTSPFPDPTFGGVLPEMTQQELVDGFELNEVNVVFYGNFYRPFLASPGSSDTLFSWIDAYSEPLGPPVQIATIGFEKGDVFQVQFFGPSPPLTVCDGDYVSLQSVFTPTQLGGHRDTLIIQSNDSTDPILRVDVRGCTGSTSDCDGDGVFEGSDNCPDDINADQSDSDRDGKGNACDSTFDIAVLQLTAPDYYTFPGSRFNFDIRVVSNAGINASGNLELTVTLPDGSSRLLPTGVSCLDFNPLQLTVNAGEEQNIPCYADIPLGAPAGVYGVRGILGPAGNPDLLEDSLSLQVLR